jgi:hypothetical protein
MRTLSICEYERLIACAIITHYTLSAFIRPFIDQDNMLGIITGRPRCTPDECSADVTLELIVFFIGDQIVSRVEEVFIPMLMTKIRGIHVFRKKVQPIQKPHWPQHYKDEKRMDYEGVDSDYFQKAVQYTYGEFYDSIIRLCYLHIHVFMCCSHNVCHRFPIGAHTCVVEQHI